MSYSFGYEEKEINISNELNCVDNFLKRVDGMDVFEAISESQSLIMALDGKIGHFRSEAEKRKEDLSDRMYGEFKRGHRKQWLSLGGAAPAVVVSLIAIVFAMLGILV